MDLNQPGSIPDEAAFWAAPQRPVMRSYDMRCTSCHASAHVTLELLTLSAGMLRCLSCGANRVTVAEVSPALS